MSAFLAVSWVSLYINERIIVCIINEHYALSIKGAGGVRPFHATDLRAPEGTGNLAIKIPKGTLFYSHTIFIKNIYQLQM